MDNSQQRRRRAKVIVFVVVLLVLVAGVFWFAMQRKTPPRASDSPLSETAKLSLNEGANLGTEDKAKREYETQLRRKNTIQKASDSEKMAYYRYLVQAAIVAKLCKESSDAAKEFESVDIVSAYSSYIAVLQCYGRNGQATEAETLKQYLRDNIMKLPQERRGVFLERINA